MKKHIYLIKVTILLFLLPLFLGGCSIFKCSTKKEGKKRIIDYYISDKDGNRISKIQPPNYFYLVVVSENMIGEEATISIEEEDEEVGYIYNGIYLGDKIHFKFKIKNDKQKLKLYIYNPQNRYHRYLKEKAKNPPSKIKDWIYTPFLRLTDSLNL